jgi:hypothetical protein
LFANIVAELKFQFCVRCDYRLQFFRFDKIYAARFWSSAAVLVTGASVRKAS